MKNKFKKVKTEHHILGEFHKFLLQIEKHPNIKRIIPGRINRQQKSSSKIRFSISYPTPTGLKCIMSKGSTAQELFVICTQNTIQTIENYLKDTRIHFSCK